MMVVITGKQGALRGNQIIHPIFVLLALSTQPSIKLKQTGSNFKSTDVIHVTVSLNLNNVYIWLFVLIKKTLKPLNAQKIIL